MNTAPALQRLHHAAWRCSDSERTRQFYEGLLGLPLVHAFEIHETRTGRPVQALHTFFQLGDGACLAFFEVPGMPFEFKHQHDFDLHIALEVEHWVLGWMRERAERAGVEVRGLSDHGAFASIYLRDPDGYVVELAAPKHGARADRPDPAAARRALDDWQRHRRA